ncbi:cyclin-I2 isoform X3 [Kogia breviceps]|uniref:cyclin-I2 isoform X3 n=1 Tax=Kogia breviceps TaxID=27615 RepID=UPI0034D2CECF
MASGGRPAPETSASEIRSVRRPGESPDESLGETVLRCLLPPPPWNVSLPAAIRRSFPEACLHGAVSLPEPSWTRPMRGAMWPRPAARPAPGAALGPPPPSPPVPSRPGLVPSDWGGVLDERQLDAHLAQAQGREARLWLGGRLQQVEICEAFQEVVLGLLRVENIFDFSQTTFNLALTIFSRLIVSVKLIPRIKDFIKHYGSGYSPNELLRMELAILDKLHWDLYSGTPLDFLTIVSTSLPWTRCAFRTAVHNIGWQSTRPCICSTVR